MNESDLINFVTYKMPHPLKNEVELKYKINQDADVNNC